MIYRVQGTFLYEKAQEFYQKLTDGTIAQQRPDGPEMIASMERARIDDEGRINWTEMCFCPTPLQHERATVYDHYFTNMVTEVINDHEEIEGASFIEQISSH